MCPAPPSGCDGLQIGQSATVSVAGLRRARPWLVAAIGIAAMTPGCSSSSPKGTVTGGLVLINPSGVGGTGVPGSVEARQAESGKTARVMTDNDGRFRLALAPGTYTLVGHTSLPGTPSYDCNAPSGQSIQVYEGGTAQADLQCKRP